MIEHEGNAFAVKGSRLLQWSHSQYGLAIPRASVMKARLLTPPLIVSILAKGYQPRWHPSAIAVNLDDGEVVMTIPMSPIRNSASGCGASLILNAASSC